MVETVLGLDYGRKRVGVAIGNTLTGSAQPLAIVSHTDKAQVLARIVQLVRQWDVRRVVVGVPRHPDGTAHEMTVQCLAFADALHHVLPEMPLELMDERYSSAVLPTHARTNAQGKTRSVAKDDAAAAVILQQYFDG